MTGIGEGWKALVEGDIMVFGIRVLTSGRVGKEDRAMGGLLGTECGIMRCGGMYLVGFPMGTCMGGGLWEGEATLGVRGWWEGDRPCVYGGGGVTSCLHVGQMSANWRKNLKNIKKLVRSC